MGKWRIWHNQVLHALFRDREKNKIIKSSRVKWARHVARMGKKSVVRRVSTGKLKKTDPREDV